MFRHPAVSQTLSFLNDVPRNTWYRDRIQQLAPGKIVFEAGCGSGLLAAYALESGAKHYYGIDINKHRSAFTANLLDRLGYKDRHTVWCADAGRITREDVDETVDLVICEQTGHQMHNNFTMRDFFQNLRPLFPAADFLPDTWCLDAYIYEGCHEGNLPEYMPQILLDDPNLPRGYKQAIDSFDYIQPEMIKHNVLTITPDNSHESLGFDLDLAGFKSATIVLVDSIRFLNEPCISQSILTDCVVPASLVIAHANGKFRFSWNARKRVKNFSRGFWDWQQHE